MCSAVYNFDKIIVIIFMLPEVGTKICFLPVDVYCLSICPKHALLTQYLRLYQTEIMDAFWDRDGCFRCWGSKG